MTPDSRQRPAVPPLPDAANATHAGPAAAPRGVSLRAFVHGGVALLIALSGVATALFVACSPPPIGWQGAGRDQSGPETQMPVDSGTEEDAGSDANDGGDGGDGSVSSNFSVEPPAGAAGAVGATGARLT